MGLKFLLDGRTSCLEMCCSKAINLVLEFSTWVPVQCKLFENVDIVCLMVNRQFLDQIEIGWTNVGPFAIKTQKGRVLKFLPGFVVSN